MPLFKTLKLLSFASNTTEEEAVARASKERNEACAELRARMRKNEVYCHQQLAKAAAVNEHLQNHHASLKNLLSESEADRLTLQEFERDVQADMLLDKRKPLWEKAVSTFMEVAEGQDLASDNDNADTTTLAATLCEQMSAAEPAPNGGEVAAAVVLYHPDVSIDTAVKVMHAQGDVGLTTGKNLRRSKQDTHVSKAIWSVLTTGNPLLSNPHGHEEAEGGVSVVPLYASNRSRFGVLVSGPSPVPDPFLELLASRSAQFFERIGKLEAVWRMVRNFSTFVTKQSMGSDRLVYVRFVKSATARPYVDWEWQPLMYHAPNNEKRFELALTWKLGEPIGVFSVECGTFTPMDEHLIRLLHLIAPMMLRGVEEIEKMNLGKEAPFSTAQKVLAEFEATQSHIPQILSDEMSKCIKLNLTFYNALVEIHDYIKKVEDMDTLRLMQAIIHLATGEDHKDWKAVRGFMKNAARPVTEKLAALSLTAVKEEAPKKKGKGKGAAVARAKQTLQYEKRWNYVALKLESVDLEQLALRSPTPIKILVRWLRVAQQCMHISLAVADEQNTAEDPRAQRMFDAIDTDKSGVLSPDEVIAHLVHKCGPEPALRLMKVLDTDNDGGISKEEWHRGWRLGEFDVEADPAAEGVGRILSRHLTKRDLLAKNEQGKLKKGKSRKQVQVAPNAGAPAPAGAAGGGIRSKIDAPP